MGVQGPAKGNAQLIRQNDFRINQTSVLFNKKNT